MKFSCDKAEINTHIGMVAKAISHKPTHPVLGCVLVEANKEEGLVTLLGFDLTLGIKTSFKTKVLKSGTIAIPSITFTKLINTISEGILEFEVKEKDKDNLVMHIRSQTGNYQMRGMDVEEYPELPVITEGKNITITSDVFAELIKKTSFAAATDETKMVLTGINFSLTRRKVENEEQMLITAAATDGHRLAFKASLLKIEEDDDQQVIPEIAADITFTKLLRDEEVNLTIPAKALKEVGQILSVNKEKNLQLCFDEGQIFFGMGNQSLFIRKLEGVYPHYKQLIPDKFTSQMTIDRKRLLDSSSCVDVFSEIGTSKVIKCTIDRAGQKIVLVVDAKETGSAKEIIMAEIITEENVPKDSISEEIGFNTKYWIEGLKILSCQNVIIKMNGNTNPVIVSPEDDDKTIYLIMPVQLRS
jgi:DNA polymerase-3 subunit beta